MFNNPASSIVYLTKQKNICTKKPVDCVVVYEEQNKSEGLRYTPVGGFNEFNETPIKGAIREAYEESFIKIKESDLLKNNDKDGILYGKKCHYYFYKIPKVSRSEYLKNRYCDEKKLPKYMKETKDLTYIPISRLLKVKESDTKYIKDLYCRTIKLRRVFFDALTKCPEIKKKIKEMV